MSTRECGCVYADANNTGTVRCGTEMGSYLKHACRLHTKPASRPRTTDDDLHQYGIAFEVDGKRVDPWRVTVHKRPGD